jgi:phosphocarrier protein HPr
MTQGVTALDISLKNRRGLHARAAAKIVKTVQLFTADVEISFEGKSVTASSIMGLMFLGAQMGSMIQVRAQGPEAKEALEALEHLVNEKFFEDS